jgi:SSS family transporter
MTLHPLDLTVVALYLAVVIGLGFYFGRHQSRREFFVAGGSMGWLAVGLSVMASLFSSNSFVFYPSAAFGNSLRISLSLVAFSLMTPVVIWFFIPVYARLNVETAYQYLEHRFHVSVRTAASGLFVLLRIGWMASATFSASLVVANVAQLPQTAVIVSIGCVAVAYTMIGGMRAVMWTDVLQFLVFTSVILATLALILLQSESSLGDIFQSYFDGRQGLIVDFKPSMSLKFGTWAILIGIFLEGLSAFGADQVAVQRYLSARSETTSQRAALLNLAGMWIVIPGLLLIGVGLYAHFTAHPELLGASSLASALQQDPKLADTAMPQFARLYFPPGMTGLFLAALLAAIMSSIDSGIHSVTTALVVDFRDRLFPALKPAEDRQDVLLIRFLLVAIGSISVTLACFVGPLGDVFDIGKKLTAAFGGPLLAIFVLALFSRRATWLGVLLGALAAAMMTLVCMDQFSQWFSVWFWPIGFGFAMILGFLLSFLQRPQDSPPTYFQIMQQTKRATDPP